MQIMLFYKNKVSELEFAYLKLQILSKKQLEDQKSLSNDAFYNLGTNLKIEHKEEVDTLKKEIEKLNAEVAKYKAKDLKDKKIKK